jgi:hypothetical protein
MATQRFRRFTANATPGDFVFVAQLHEPGARTVLGQRYSEGAKAKRAPSSPTFAATQQPRVTSQQNSRAISSPTPLRPPPWRIWSASFRTPAAICLLCTAP